MCCVLCCVIGVLCCCFWRASCFVVWYCSFACGVVVVLSFRSPGMRAVLSLMFFLNIMLRAACFAAGYYLFFRV